MSSDTVAAPTADPQRRDVMVNRGLERATSIDAEGSTISFHDISYTVRVKDPNKRCGSMDKDILHSIRYTANTKRLYNIYTMLD